MKFLGYMVGRYGIQIDLDKIKEVYEWLEPKNIKDIQSFLGFGNFNRRFISNYLTIVIPLIKLIKKDVLFVWGMFQQQAFDKFK